MAITIITSPGTHTPAYNNQYFVVSGTNTAQTNFKYVCKTYIHDNSGNTTLVATEKISKRPDNGWLYFNPQKIVESYVRNEFETALTDFQYSLVNSDSQRGLQKVTQVFNEEYGSPVSGIAAGATGVYYVWNGAYAGLDFSNFTYSTSTVAKDLTLSPSLTDTINYNQKYLFKTWHRGFSTRNIRYLNVIAYNSAGTILNQTVLLNQWYDTTLDYRRNYIYYNCSPYGFNNITAGAIVSQTVPGNTIPTNTYRYTFYFDDGAGPPNVSSNTNTVYIDDYCSKYTPYILHFLNKLGNYDSFTFNLVSRYNTDKESLNYKKVPYALNSSNKYTYAQYASDTAVYGTVLTNKRQLISGWVTEAQASWLRDLIMSPSIYFETMDDTNVVGDQSALYSVKCTMKNYETKIKAQDKLINITIDLEYDIQDVRQRG